MTSLGGRHSELNPVHSVSLVLGVDDFDSVFSKDADDGKGCVQKHERVPDQQSLLVEPQDGREDARR